MSLVATLSTSEPRAIPMGGPLKYEIQTYTVGTGITTGTITASNLHTVYHCILDGVRHTALPVCTTNSVALTFTDPAATVFGTAILIGV